MPRTIKNNELKIAAILMGKKYDTKLWSCIFGDVYLKNINNYDNIIVKHHAIETKFLQNGKIWADGEVCLFPSKEMQDWEKFAWKKGDVLVHTDGEEPYYAIFESFQDDEYTAFKSRYNYSGGNYWLQFNSQSSTNHFAKVSDDEAKEFIKKVEEHYGGKLNLSTLQIEPKPEFKDGDIVFVKGAEYYEDYIEIFRQFDDGEICDHASYDIKHASLDCSGKYQIGKSEYQNIRLATDSEKQQLLSKLEEIGKKWNPDTLQIEDLPKKYEFLPFDKVLVRNVEDEIWIPRLFAYYGDTYVVCTDGEDYQDCIPYNDETKHLLGTTYPF